MIEDPGSLFTTAMDAYHQGNDMEAALSFARARYAAQNLRDHATAFKAGIWEVECHRSDGRYRQAMELLVPLLANPPRDAPTYERWVGQKKVFQLLVATKPELASLQRALAEITALAQRQPHPDADLDFLSGQLARYCGEWAIALRHYEQAWSRKVVNEGYTECLLAYWPGHVALNHRCHSEALAWRNRLAHTDQDYHRHLARMLLTDLDARVALYEADIANLRDCRDSGAGDALLEARIHLILQPDDPLDQFHPAQILLRRRPKL